MRSSLNPLLRELLQVRNVPHHQIRFDTICRQWILCTTRCDSSKTLWYSRCVCSISCFYSISPGNMLRESFCVRGFACSKIRKSIELSSAFTPLSIFIDDKLFRHAIYWWKLTTSFLRCWVKTQKRNFQNWIWREEFSFTFWAEKINQKSSTFYLISRVEKRLNFGSSEAFKTFLLQQRPQNFLFLVLCRDFSRRGLKIIFNDNEWSRNALLVCFPFISSVGYCFEWVRWIAGNCIFMLQLEGFFTAPLTALSN